MAMSFVTQFLAAARDGDIEICAKMLARGIHVDVADTLTSETPLHYAVVNGLAACKFLFDAGANIEARDYLGRTPLMLAACHNKSDICAFLLDRGADIDAVCKRHNSALNFATSRARYNACFVLLLDRGANVNIIQECKRSLLESAAHEKMFAKCKMLLEYGANAGICKLQPDCPLEIKTMLVAWGCPFTDISTDIIPYISASQEGGFQRRKDAIRWWFAVNAIRI
jgi:ankyrin repeat protein